MVLRFLLVYLLTLTAIPPLCFAQPGLQVADQDPEIPINAFHRKYLEQYVGFPIAEDSRLDLYDTIASWLGTPYRYAGNCHKGIDCSGLVYVLCSQVYGFNPGARTSHGLYDLADKIDSEQMKEGDLLFFKIHKNRISHVGMYLNGGKFVHASSSRGVIISDLNEPYYRKYFAGSGRISHLVTGEIHNP